MIPRISSYFLIIFDNLIPIIGYTFFNWNLTLIFAFYAVELSAYELVMIPRIVIYSHTCGEYMLYAPLKKIGLSISWLLYHLMLYAFTIMFLLHTAYAVSPGASAPVKLEELWSFSEEYSLVIFLVFGSYLMDFFNNYLVLKEYEVLPSDLQLKEIALSYLILLIALALINGFATAFSMDSEVYQIVMMFAIIGFKTAAQVMLRRGKTKYIG